MATPADLQALINAVPWANTTGLITGVDEQALWDACVAVFEAEGGTVWPTVGAPSSGLGNNNDYAIDQTNKIMYGPKASGAWPGGTSFGGGGGGSSVNSIAALQALSIPANGAAVVLNDMLRGGTFIFSTANLSAAVSADPANGEYAAPSSDTTGASGAWVRQFVGAAEFAWFGADGTTANTSAAMQGFGQWARYTQVAKGNGTINAGIEVHYTPWFYQFDLALCQRWRCGITKLKQFTEGAIFQNVTTNASWKLPWDSDSIPIFGPTGTHLNDLISSTTQGATTVTCLTPANAAKYLVGASVMIACLDVQYAGFPPNLYRFEFRKVTAFNSGTGVVTLDQPLQLVHLSTFPDGTPGNNAAGAARIWQLDIDYSSLFSYLPLPIPWDIERYTEGLTILNPSNAGATVDMSINGKSQYFKNCNLNAHSPSVAGRVIFENCTDPLLSEPDKLVKSILYLGGSYFSVPFASSSIDCVSAIGTRFQTLTAGGKYFYAHGCDIDTLNSPASSFGLNLSWAVEYSNVKNYSGALSFNGQGVLTIDGTNTTYANGVISMPNNNVVGVVPGQKLNFSFTGNFQVKAYSGDIGDCEVVSVSQSGSFVLIQTTLQSAAVPAFCTNGVVYVNRTGYFSARGSTGCSQIGRAAAASQAGYQEGKYWKDTISGKSATGGDFNPYGTWDYCEINVRTPTAGISTPHLTLSATQLFTKTNPLVSVAMSLVIDLTTPGKRVLTQQAVFLLGSDAFTVAGSSATSLPQIYFFCGATLFAWGVNYTPSAQAYANLPQVSILNRFDTGSFGELNTANIDSNNHTLVESVGNIYTGSA